MFRKKKVKAEIVEVISNIRKSENCRDYDGEYYAQRESRYRDPDARWYSYGSYPSWQREDDFYEYTKNRSGYFTIKNEWTGELELHREFTWYEIKLKIRYYVSKVPYEKIIDIQSRAKDIKYIVLYCERKNPENIIELYFAENWGG